MRKPQGHYCRICQQYKANEKFSGRGHANHICMACARRGNKPPDIEIEPPVFIDTNAFDIDADNFAYDVEFGGFAFPTDDEQSKPKKKRKPSKEKLLRAEQRKKVKAFLTELLSNGDMNTSAILEAANKNGITHEGLRRAKGSLGIRTINTENGSVWRLPMHTKQPESSKIANEGES